jgi:hypothetical protein
MKTSLSSQEFCDIYISSLKRTNASFARGNRRREETRFDDVRSLFLLFVSSVSLWKSGALNDR